MDVKKTLTDRVLDRPGSSLSSTIGLLAAVALIIGFFMPWTSLPDSVESGLGVSKSRLMAVANARDDPKTPVEETDVAIGKLIKGEAISGAAWAEVLDAVAAESDLEERGQRRLHVARIGVLGLPFAAGLLALLLLTMVVPAGAAMKVGFAPLAIVLRIAQSRFFRGLVLVVTMALAAIVFFVSDLLWLGVKTLDQTEGKAGVGIQLMAGGSAVALLSSFFGYGPGRLRALAWVAILLVLIGVGVYVALST